MKTKFPSILGVFAAILMVASFVIPVNIAAPSPASADPGIMKWDTVITPNAVAGKNDLYNPQTTAGDPNTDKGNEILSMAVGNDGMTIFYVVRTWATVATWKTATSGYHNVFFYSNTAGIADSSTRYPALARNTQWQALMNAANNPELFQVRGRDIQRSDGCC